MTKPRADIVFKYNEWECSDGCCSEYWYDCYVNGEKLELRYGSPDDAIVDVLVRLGFDADMAIVHEGDEEGWN